MRIAYLFISYPGLSQSFLHREIAGLARQGLKIEIHALWKKGRATPESVPEGSTLRGFSLGDWLRLLPALLQELFAQPRLVVEAWSLLRQYPPRFGENWQHTFLGTAFALVRAKEFRKSDIQHIHAAWATAPATAAAVLHRLTGLPFSFGAQAYDIYRRGGDAFLAPKMRAARFIHTTTQANVGYLTEKCPEASDKIQLIRRGLERLPEVRTYSDMDRPLHLLSVARLIAKKGHHWQLAAAAILQKQGLAFELKLVGDGPLRNALAEEAEQLGLAKSVHFCGHLSQSEVQILYSWADVFWHTGIIDEEGDRDGLPNVVPEAMGYGTPIVASHVGAVTEAILHEQTGLVVDVSHPDRLAEATLRLASDVTLRRQLGMAGRLWVKECFLSENNSLRMAELYRDAHY